MNIKVKISVACLVFATLVGAAAAQSGAKGAWVVLFDGNSTDRWRGYKRDAFPDKGWVIEGGALKTVVGGDRVDLVTKDKYQNYELELEWRVSPGGNSGVIYNVSEDLTEAWNTGPEMQVLDDSKHPDGKNPKTSSGSLYALIAPAKATLRPVGEFNKARLVVHGTHVEHWLNGKKVVEYEWGSDDVKKLIAASKFKEFPRFAGERGGHIVLQHHGEEAWFRNIRIRELDTK